MGYFIYDRVSVIAGLAYFLHQLVVVSAVAEVVKRIVLSACGGLVPFGAE